MKGAKLFLTFFQEGQKKMSAVLLSACLIYITFHARCMDSEKVRYDSITQHTRREGNMSSDIVTKLSVKYVAQ